MGYRILVVEDHKQNTILADCICSLEQQNMDVTTVPGIELCSEVASIINPDVIVIDTSSSAQYQSICEKLRANPFVDKTPMVVLSDNDTEVLENTWVTAIGSAEKVTNAVHDALAHIDRLRTVH